MIVLFAGPSLGRGAVASADIELRPPAAEGDVYRAARERPRAIALIDGYFEAQPAVWHKEILWAMAQGIHVYGAASMGALRAAELHSFGMVGIGTIFRAYRRGVLQDDSEVAVLHGPAELGYPVLTEALVNVRATLAAARTAGIISPLDRRKLVAIAAQIFYKERTWASILAGARLPPSRAAALRRWLPGGRVDLKARDAGRLVAALRLGAESLQRPARPDFVFEATSYWRRLVDRQAAEPRRAAAAGRSRQPRASHDPQSHN